MRLIRQYNSLFAFSSLGVHVDKSINTGDGPYVFRINGVVHHRIGSPLPAPGRRPEYAQFYIYDIKLSGTIDSHGDRYSLPVVPELAALLIGGLSPNVSSFDVVVEAHTSELKQISPIHPALMSLQYPLLSPMVILVSTLG
jgi:hypothetical protein